MKLLFTDDVVLIRDADRPQSMTGHWLDDFLDKTILFFRSERDGLSVAVHNVVAPGRQRSKMIFTRAVFQGCMFQSDSKHRFLREVN